MLKTWRRPEILLMLMAAAVPLSFASWQALLNNFIIERAAFTGAEIGILQSLREIPGFLAFTVIYILLLLREQSFAIIALLLLGVGTALTGVFPNIIGLYCTTVIMSIGFHYYETLQTSLTLQWVDKAQAPIVLGKLIAVGGFTSLAAYGIIFIGMQVFELDFIWIYIAGGGLTIVMAIAAWLLFPKYTQKVEQHKTLILRKRYWLYYVLIFLSGARRQIFVVFAGFMMVEKFGYSVSSMIVLLWLNHSVNIFLAPYIGKLIHRWGERSALTFEYIGLIIVFTAYAFVSDPVWAASLYVIDHLFFALAIAIKTYFQKIADPADIASSSGVSFTINHIAAVGLPAPLGLLWLVSPAAVFIFGAIIALISLIISRLVPNDPAPGNEVVVWNRKLLLGGSTINR